MRSAEMLIYGGLVGMCVVGWSAYDSPGITTRLRGATVTPIRATRLYTGPDSQTHAEPMDIKLTPHARLARNDQSEAIEAAALVFSRRSPGFATDWHPSAQPTYQITMSGRGEIEVGGGHRIAVGPGEVVLLGDITGRGHRARTIGTDDWVVGLVPVKSK